MDVKLSTWAADNGLKYQAAYKMFKAGTLPVPARQLTTGTILVAMPPSDTFTRQQLERFQAQLDRIEQLCLFLTDAISLENTADCGVRPEASCCSV
jgi:hypothetical protein